MHGLCTTATGSSTDLQCHFVRATQLQLPFGGLEVLYAAMFDAPLFLAPVHIICVVVQCCCPLLCKPCTSERVTLPFVTLTSGVGAAGDSHCHNDCATTGVSGTCIQYMIELCG